MLVKNFTSKILLRNEIFGFFWSNPYESNEFLRNFSATRAVCSRWYERFFTLPFAHLLFIICPDRQWR
jgi:hypothetical protein